MLKIKRKIIEIDREKCDSCGRCIINCPEQAIRIVGGKAQIVKDFYCDGLGACIGSCPRDAIKILEKEAEAYDEEKTVEHIKETKPEMLDMHLDHMKKHGQQLHSDQCCHVVPSGNWPIQIHLISPSAPNLKNTDLLVAADCTAFKYVDFHKEFAKDRVLLIGCPKLDDAEEYVKKLTEILSQTDIKSIKIVRMEVPCCFGLTYIVQRAMSQAKKDIPFEEIIISTKGDICKHKE